MDKDPLTANYDFDLHATLTRIEQKLTRLETLVNDLYGALMPPPLVDPPIIQFPYNSPEGTALRSEVD